MAETVVILPKLFLIYHEYDGGLYAKRYDHTGSDENGIRMNTRNVDGYCYMTLDEQQKGTNKVSFKLDNGAYVSYHDNGILTGSWTRKSVFEIIPLNDKKFAIKAENGKFVRIYDTDGVVYPVADLSIIDQYCRFTLEEPFYKKNIIDVKYDLSKATTKDETPFMAGSLKVENSDYQTPSENTLRYEYTKSEVGTWNNTVGTELTVTTSFEAGVPFITKANFEIAVSASASHEWGGSKGEERRISGESKVTVPPRKKGEIKMMVSQATLVVPLVYKTKTWYNNGQVIEKEEVGKYVNLDSYNLYVNNSQLVDI